MSKYCKEFSVSTQPSHVLCDQGLFDSKGWEVRLTSYVDHGKVFWRQDSVWDEAGYLKSIVSGQTGDKWTRREYDRSGAFVSETPTASPADLTW